MQEKQAGAGGPVQADPTNMTAHLYVPFSAANKCIHNVRHLGHIIIPLSVTQINGSIEFEVFHCFHLYVQKHIVKIKTKRHVKL